MPIRESKTLNMYAELNEAAEKPVIWSKYTADVLWTDGHIAKQMLAFHLNPSVSIASRTAVFIDNSVDWLVSTLGLNSTSKTIDFGCGPGLYTQRLKTKGIGNVVGVDFSKSSLAHAAHQATSAGLNIEYQHCDYLKYTDTRKFDLITLVMCDLCALNPDQRATLLGKFKSMLQPEGKIALDVYTDRRFAAQQASLDLEKNAMGGFWSTDDYWCVKASFTYDVERVTLDKYTIFEESRQWTVYNWLQHFDLASLNQELCQHGLKIIGSYNDLCGNPIIGGDGDEMALIITHC